MALRNLRPKRWGGHPWVFLGVLSVVASGELNSFPAAAVSASAPSPEVPRLTNRLAKEKSPYLLQHRHNPVDWYPWGEEAFTRARVENKPIFLSIGYSTCHWCHVMERESFEDAATAAVLNEHFVSIKMDREERPDVDKIYMTYIQARTGSGGWPLNVFLTPDLKPFYGGTYWPPEGKFGRPGFREVLKHIAGLWRDRPDELKESADDMANRMRQFAAQESSAKKGALPSKIMSKAADEIKGEYDARHGGFGGAPKFPRPSQPSFLLRHAQRSGDAKGVRMVLHTGERMAAGGMHDQLGGGFARYSVDAEWLVPHFEKMLYDNAQLVHLYLDAFLVSGEVRFADIARSTIGYVLRDMTHPDGGFYSAEDADSEGHEGKFYCWTQEELASLLPADELGVVTRRYGITRKGNFEDHSHPQPLKGLNVLSIVDPKLTPDEVRVLESAKARMLVARSKRVRPHLDDKILTSWNGLMLGAMARAAVILDEPKWLAAAERNVAFLKERLWDGQNGTLFHRWRDGERDTVQLLDDYAFLLDGVVHLYEATLRPEHLQFAIQIADGLLARFHDPGVGGFWQSGPGAKDLIVRFKEEYDGAEPSGNSVATLALLRLASITERGEYRQAAEQTLRYFSDRLAKAPQTVPYLLQALDFSVEEPKRVVIAGAEGEAATGRLIKAAHSVYQPRRVILGTRGPVEPFARTLSAKEDQPTAYVCTGTACQPPTRDPAKVMAMVK
ncbi:MAG: thioredoxin domain-containing protein [Verrucomicrobiales bacterium]|nr:thioredoxin domain-containing protein [Verrucomicrobiales bacterium]